VRSLLIVANLCHASPRIPGLARYLPSWGWLPVIVSPGLTDGQKDLYLFERGRDITIVETTGYTTAYGIAAARRPASLPIRAIRGLGRRLYQKTLYPIVSYPDGERKWTPYCLAEVTGLCATRRFDAILSSSSPVTCHIIAKRISRETGIPWVADLRDPWTQNHAYPFGFLRKSVERSLEKRTLASAAHLVTVTPQWVEQLRELHSNPATCVANGYDERYSPGPVPLSQKFTLTYTGSIYPRRSNPRLIVAALDELLRKDYILRGDVELRFFGTARNEIVQELGDHARYVNDWITVYERVPRLESYRRQQESQVLVLFNWEAPGEKGVAPGKIYEYLRARRPIIATGGYGGDFVESALRNTKAGKYCVTHKQVMEQVLAFYHEYRKDGSVGYEGLEQEIQKYDYQALAKSLAGILDSVVR
jgi:hypothetical protein